MRSTMRCYPRFIHISAAFHRPLVIIFDRRLLGDNFGRTVLPIELRFLLLISHGHSNDVCLPLNEGG